MRSALRIPLAVILALPAGYCLLSAGRLAEADYRARPDTIEALRSAIQLQPSNADYHARIATLDPSSDDELREALRLNPWRPSWWIMRSVHEEELGDAAAAEADLINANAVAQLYKPRWTLTFFYYRQHNLPAFAKWARAALDAANYGDSESVFRMAHKLGFTPRQILTDIVPANPDRVVDYLSTSFDDRKPEDSFAPASRLLDLHAFAQRDAVFATADVLFRANSIDSAIELWNRAIKAGWIGLSPLDPAAGKSQARTTFRGERLEKGFDWKYPQAAGVSVSTAEPDGSMRAEFSGNEPENCEIAFEDVPLLPGRTYTLSSNYRTESIPANAGVRWIIATAKDGQAIATLPLSDPPAPITFRAPAAQTPTTLSLRYIRNPGTTRPEGTLWIKSVELKLVP